MSIYFSIETNEVILKVSV